MSALRISLLVALAPVAGHGQCLLQDFTETTPPLNGVMLGWDIAADDGVVAATAYGDLDPLAHHVWIWRRAAGAWVQEAELVPPQVPLKPGNGGNDRVALDDGVLAIARNYAVALYHHDGTQWVFDQLIPSPGPGLFGRSLALRGDLLVIGRPELSPTFGSAYVYRRQGATFTFEAELTGDQPLNSFFGAAVTVEGDTVAVADTFDSTLAGYAGSVHVYRRIGGAWQLEAKLDSPLAGYPDKFGSALALQGDDLAVHGTLSVDPPFNDTVHFFHRTGTQWTEIGSYSDPQGGLGNELGADLDIEGDVLVAGERGYDGFAPNSGSALVFRRVAAGWDLVARLEPEAAEQSDQFGESVALDGERVLTAAVAMDGAFPDEGRLFEFGALPGSTFWSATGPALAGSDDEPCLFLEGQPGAGQLVDVTLVHALPGAAALMVVGAGELSAPLKGGVLVPTPDVIFAGLLVGAAGQITFTAAWPALAPGSEFFLQAWIPDGAAPAGFAASNGVHVVAP